MHGSGGVSKASFVIFRARRILLYMLSSHWRERELHDGIVMGGEVKARGTRTRTMIVQRPAVVETGEIISERLMCRHRDLF